jgi:hypothetical protein
MASLRRITAIGALVDHDNPEELTHVTFLSCAFLEITPQCSIGVAETFVSAGHAPHFCASGSQALLQPLA